MLISLFCFQLKGKKNAEILSATYYTVVIYSFVIHNCIVSVAFRRYYNYFDSVYGHIFFFSFFFLVNKNKTEILEEQ